MSGAPPLRGASCRRELADPRPEGGALSHFTRAATMRVLQQVRPKSLELVPSAEVGYFMRHQDEAMQSVLAKAASTSPKAGRGATDIHMRSCRELPSISSRPWVQSLDYSL